MWSPVCSRLSHVNAFGVVIVCYFTSFDRLEHINIWLLLFRLHPFKCSCVVNTTATAAAAVLMFPDSIALFLTCLLPDERVS